MVAATAAGVHGGGAKGVVIHADGVGCVTDRAWGAADPEQNGMSGGGRRLASGAAKPGVKSRLGGRVEVAGAGARSREKTRGGKGQMQGRPAKRRASFLVTSFFSGVEIVMKWAGGKIKTELLALGRPIWALALDRC
jgi:hypothetical protein